jgi:glutathione synthase/RimK-type ligase-like ATP-grasp enzyme
MKGMSKDWIIEVSTTDGKKTIVFGYTFAVNSAVALEICKEKPATAMVLESANVPAVEHTVILNPAKDVAAGYLPKGGVWAEFIAFFEKHNGCVLKPLKGTGGFGVERVKTRLELEAAVQRLFSVEYGLAASPYLEIEDEIRSVCAFGAVKLMYRKTRCSVKGDGKSTVKQLAGERLHNLNGKQARMFLTSLANLSAQELDSIPAENEEVPIEWRHNLGLGATADFNVEDDLRARVSEMALRAMEAVHLTFGSVDIVIVKGELMVLEINIGVMMDNLIDQGKENMAYEVYDEVLTRCLA